MMQTRHLPRWLHLCFTRLGFITLDIVIGLCVALRRACSRTKAQDGTKPYSGNGPPARPRLLQTRGHMKTTHGQEHAYRPCRLPSSASGTSTRSWSTSPHGPAFVRLDMSLDFLGGKPFLLTLAFRPVRASHQAESRAKISMTSPS